MKHYKKGPGPYYLFYRDHHLGSIEAVSTIAEAVLFKSAGLTQQVWCAEVIALAKRDLPAGKKLDQRGGYDYYGLMEKAEIAAKENLLPIGLAEFATLTCDVSKDQVITNDMVELEDNLVVQLRKEQDSFSASLL
jgi:predicted homoserine dehydrogenase-like protein